MPSGAQPPTATSGKELEFDQAEVLAVPRIQFLSPYHLHEGGFFLAIKQLNTPIAANGGFLEMRRAGVSHRCTNVICPGTSWKNIQKFEKPQQARLAALPACQLPGSTSQYCQGKGNNF